MGTESSTDPQTDLQSYYDTLDSENITFVDALNEEIAALVQNAPELNGISIEKFSTGILSNSK